MHTCLMSCKVKVHVICKINGRLFGGSRTILNLKSSTDWTQAVVDNLL